MKWDLKDQREYKVHKGSKEIQVNKVKEAEEERGAEEEKMEIQVKWDLKDQKEYKVHKESKEIQANKVKEAKEAEEEREDIVAV